MSTRSFVLAITAAAVFAMGVYLFIAVRSSPLQAEAAAAPPPPSSTSVGAPALAVVQANPAARPSEVVRHTVTSKPAMQAAVAVRQSEPTDDHDGSSEPSIDDMIRANPKLDAVMDRANKAYDRQDFDEAKSVALKVLAKQPTNVRMLRILVSSSCLDGDTPMAQKYFPLLPKFDRDQMKLRCDRNGVTLTDP